ncbi:unnamed protein product [Cylindrotheca closterium]|uniref:D-xylose 1-dehydrogenase (NADP(+), D-xylono-1,5-lactone-forming) n=1 Tax=Cylindrotheca closterium TaxID=2856 RepID=A0AAD2G2D5_9STRA|nr:unnamed protein product [Cylindrotheca closterium]
MFPRFALFSVTTAVLAYAFAPMAQRLLFLMPASTAVSKDPSAIKVGLVGAADIAKFAVLWPASRESSVVVTAVAARSVDKAKAYAAKHGIPKVHSNYQELIMDPDIDVVYIGVITELHYAITQYALQHGKHVLLEKPAVFLEHEAKKLVALAREQNKILLEAFHWRYHPAAIRVQELVVEQKVVGSLESMELKASLYDPMASKAEGAAKQSVKLFDRWCYLVDEMHYYLPKDQWDIEIESVEMMPTKMHAKLTATPVESPDLEKGEGGGASAVKPVQITMDAYKDKLEIPSWYVSFQGSNGSLRYDNALFPFIYHKITKPDGTVEQRYTAAANDTSENAVGKSTFAHQLEIFASLLTEQDEWKKAKTNQALWASMIRNAKMAERMVAASDQTPVSSWTFPQDYQMPR